MANVPFSCDVRTIVSACHQFQFLKGKRQFISQSIIFINERATFYHKKLKILFLVISTDRVT